jgi:transcriptional regulator with XRE-family HTH domain
MRVDVVDPATYESWDMTAAAIPPRSRFFNLSPAGLGTSMVECLTSYISRLAQAHSVTPGVLHHREIMKYGAPGRNGLQYLTLLPWKALFPAPMLMRGVAAWCPACLSKWAQAGKPAYVPLLWTLEVVKFCPFHRRPLRVSCPHCELPQPLLGQCSWVGFCTRCKRWLGSDSGHDDAERFSVLRQETPDWEIWVADQIADMIEAGFHNPPMLTKSQFAQLVRLGTDFVGMSALARILGVSAGAVSHWRMGDRNPLLPAYLRVARVLNVTLVDLLTGKVSPDKVESLNLAGMPYWRNLWNWRSAPFNRVRAARQLDAALKEVPPPSLHAVRKRNQYHYATLHRHFPEQCRAIQERFREHSAALLRQRHANKIAEFREIAYQLHEQGTTLCVNRILTRMSVPKSLNYPIARGLLAEIKREILAKEHPPAKPRGTMAKQRTSPGAFRAQTE